MDQVSKSFLQNYPRTVIPNGIDRTIFRPQSSSLREKYHLEDKKIVLGVANAWNARKGLPDLLTLAGRLDSDYHVVLIGLIEKQLPDIPSDVLGLLRTANQTELAQWYSAADVFVNPMLRRLWIFRRSSFAISIRWEHIPAALSERLPMAHQTI